MLIIDINCAIGPFLSMPMRQFGDTVELVSEMDHFGIDRAIVYHSYSLQSDPQEGNKLIDNECKSNSRLNPSWVLLPNDGLEMPKVSSLILNMHEAGVKALHMFPKQHGYPVHNLTCGTIFEELALHRLPLLIPWSELTWDEINWICGNYPKLPVILIEAEYSAGRKIYPLLKAYNNLYIEISRYFIHEGIEDICKHVGAHKLVFGSNMPFYNPAAILGSLHYAEISDDQRTLILSGNIERLFAGIKW